MFIFKLMVIKYQRFGICSFVGIFIYIGETNTKETEDILNTEDIST